MNYGLPQWLPFRSKQQAWYERYFNGSQGHLIWPALGGVALGAGLMFILDPDRGRRRRAVARDKVTSAVNKTGEVIGKKSRDLKNRAQGVVAEASSLFHGEQRSEVAKQHTAD